MTNDYRTDTVYPHNNADNTEYLQPDEPCSPIADSLSFSTFAAAIRARGMEHFDDTEIDADFAEKFLNRFAVMADEALMKFAAGQREHGGDIRERNLRREMRMEILDLLCYTCSEDTLDDSFTVPVS